MSDRNAERQGGRGRSPTEELSLQRLERMLMQVVKVQQQQATLLASRPPLPSSSEPSPSSSSDLSSHDASPPVHWSQSQGGRRAHQRPSSPSRNLPLPSPPLPPPPDPMFPFSSTREGTTAPHPSSSTPRHLSTPAPKLFSFTTPPPSSSTRALQVNTHRSGAPYREPRTPVSSHSASSDSSESSSGSASYGRDPSSSPRLHSLSRLGPVRTQLSPSMRASPYPSPSHSANPIPTLEAWKFPGQSKGKRRVSKVKERTPDSLPFPHTSNSARSMSRLVEGSRRYTKVWRVRGVITEPRSLLISPLSTELRMPGLHGDFVPPDPNHSEETRALLDAFTRTLWDRHEHAVKAGNKKTLYAMKSLIPDSYYIHIVKELHQPGHLERCGLPHTDTEMYNSIKNKINRNVRFMLFDVDPTAVQSCGLDRDSWCAPMLYVVRRTSIAKSTPSPEDCQRVFPISQIRPLLERLHKECNCRAVGIEKMVASEFIGVTRDTARFYQQHCLTCKEHQRLDHRQKLVQSIRSTHPRHRYVIDLIEMLPCNVRHEGQYKFILVMVDHFSRYRWTAALQNKFASLVLKELRQWWSSAGKPDILQSDNGPEFAAGEVKDFCREWGVRKRHSRPYKPQTNGTVERANRDVQERLARWQALNPGKTWVEGLSTVCAAHNECWTRTHKSKPREVFNSAPCDEWRFKQEDESMLPVEDWSDVSTSSEGDPDVQDEKDEDDGEDDEEEVSEDKEDEEILHPSYQPNSEMNYHGVDGATVSRGDVSTSEMEPVREAATAHADRMRTSPSHQAAGPNTDAPLIHPVSPLLPEQPSDSEKEPATETELEQGSDAEAAPETQNRDGEDTSSVSEMKHPLVDDADNVPDEESPALDTMGIVPPGSVSSMRYPHWKRISAPLFGMLRRAGVPALGDCGVIATVAAHQQYYFNRISPVMTDQDINKRRAMALQFLETNLARVEKDERLAVSIDELRRTIQGLRNYVAVEYLWLYAMQHCLNIYLFEVNVVKQVTRQETRATFSIRLITPERSGGNVLPVHSDNPNTIAIYFHNTATYEDSARSAATSEKERKGKGRQASVMKASEEKMAVKKSKIGMGTGHFEYLVDNKSRSSCWRTTDDIAVFLQRALEEAHRVNYLHSYTTRWVESRNRLTNARLPELAEGDLATLMISDYMREKSDYHDGLDGKGLRNMVVKVLRKSPPSVHPGPTRYQVLSHAGVLTEVPLRQELRPLGPDVDRDLKAKEVRLEDMENTVGMMQAWNFFLQRRRARHYDMGERQRMAEVAAAELQPEAVSTTAADVADPSPAAEVTEPASQKSTASAPANPKPALTPLCCSCEGAIHLSRTQEPSVCIGLCQQPMHGNPGQCKGSKKWVRVEGVGVCCSQACAALYSGGGQS